ncbi:hypothetical protein PAPYR_1917 [Paratrimastix pyriformis]|uniref:Hexosyltransferase n=1 Tax=Paratrimastix pyriformis TaxID=342808 RepID=A0ABQ8UUN3_9EUKA|nr:hypothetical protein PAPYR_1917 [Paratrimastix pyriformis]
MSTQPDWRERTRPTPIQFTLHTQKPRQNDWRLRDSPPAPPPLRHEAPPSVLRPRVKPLAELQREKQFLAELEESQRRRSEGHPDPGHSRMAYVTLVMRGDQYIPGAVVLAHSIRLTGTPFDLVCMVTSDVGAEGMLLLRHVYDRHGTPMPTFLMWCPPRGLRAAHAGVGVCGRVVLVEPLRYRCKGLRTPKQRQMYESWVGQSFTKWRALELVEYQRVVFLDADKVFLSSCDDIFDLQPPAATFGSPWSADTKAAGLYNPYASIGHGQPVPGAMVQEALDRSDSFVCVGTMVLLAPSAPDAAAFREMMAPYREGTEGPAFGQPNYSMLDEQSLALFYLRRHRAGQCPGWTMIDSRYNTIPWHPEWRIPAMGAPEPYVPRVFHYFGKNPWQQERGEWADLEAWWALAEGLLRDERYPEQARRELRALFKPAALGAPPREPSCAWCRALHRPPAEERSHDIFDRTGRLACPMLMISGPPAHTAAAPAPGQAGS